MAMSHHGTGVGKARPSASSGSMPSASGVPTRMMSQATWIIARPVHFTSGLRVV